MLDPSWAHLGPNILQHSRQDVQTTPSKRPESRKSTKKLKKIDVFTIPPMCQHASKMLPKPSSDRPSYDQDGPKSVQVEPKMAILTPSWPILGATCCHLGPNFAHLAPNLAKQFDPSVPETLERRQRPIQTSIFIDSGTLWGPIFIDFGIDFLILVTCLVHVC